MHTQMSVELWLALTTEEWKEVETPKNEKKMRHQQQIGYVWRLTQHKH